MLKVTSKFLFRIAGADVICIGGAAAIGGIVDRLNHTGVLFTLMGATIGLGIALFFTYISIRHINNR